MKQTIGFPADGEIQEHLLEPKEGGARTRIAYLYMDCLLSLCGIAFKWGTCIHCCFPFGRWKHLTPSNMAAELSRIGLLLRSYYNYFAHVKIFRSSRYDPSLVRSTY